MLWTWNDCGKKTKVMRMSRESSLLQAMIDWFTVLQSVCGLRYILLSDCYLLCVFCSLFCYNYSFYVYFLVLYGLLPILCVLCFCIVSPHLYSCFFSIFVQLCGSLPAGANTIAVNKYHTYIRDQKTNYNVVYFNSLSSKENNDSCKDLCDVM